jgi:hypothetical protein
MGWAIKGACTSYPHQPGLISPSWWKLRQKVAIATLNVLCDHIPHYISIFLDTTRDQHVKGSSGTLANTPQQNS